MPARRRSLARFLLTLALLIPQDATAQGAPAVNLTGVWSFSVNTDGGSGTPTVTLTQTGDSLSGTYSSGIFGELPLTGAVKGSDFTFECTASMQGQTFTLTFTGKIKNVDEIDGAVSLGDMGGGTFSGKRRPPG